jgi:hypothetical protein
MNPDAVTAGRPTTLGIWSKSQGKFIGIAVFKPWANNYQGVINGHVIAGNPGGRVTIDGRGRSTPPTLIRRSNNKPQTNPPLGNGAEDDEDASFDFSVLIASTGTPPQILRSPQRDLTPQDLMNACYHVRRLYRNEMQERYDASIRNYVRRIAVAGVLGTIHGAYVGFAGAEVMEPVGGGVVGAIAGGMIGGAMDATTSALIDGYSVVGPFEALAHFREMREYQEADQDSCSKDVDEKFMRLSPGDRRRAYNNAMNARSVKEYLDNFWR